MSPATTYFYIVSTTSPAGATLDSAPASATTSPTLENWRLEHFGTTENSGDAANTADPDGDGMTNEAEWSVRTDPKDTTSVLKIIDIHPESEDIVLIFTTAVGKTYRVESSATLPNNTWATIKEGIPELALLSTLKSLTKPLRKNAFTESQLVPEPGADKDSISL